MDYTDPITLIARHVFNARCLQCPNNQVPDCPQCPAGYSCAQVIASCVACAHNICTKDSQDPIINQQSTPTPSPGSGPNIGAIAGGIIGGVVFIVICTVLIWRFCIRNRRQEYDAGEQEEPYFNEKAPDPDFARRRTARLSTHTVGSTASTVLTRASNVIQIGYIPGIEDRSDSDSPSFIPPVPEIGSSHLRLQSPPQTPYTDQEGSHFFTADDLRDSYADDASSVNRQGPFLRHSLTSLGRDSVATDVYRSNAMPAQQIVRGKPNIVSVKSSPAATPSEKFTNATSMVDFQDFGTSADPQPAVQVERSLTQTPVSDAAVANVTAVNANATAPALLQTPELGRSAVRPTSRSPGPNTRLPMATVYESSSSGEPSLRSSNSQNSSQSPLANNSHRDVSPLIGSLSDSSASASRTSSPEPSSHVPTTIAAQIQEATRRASMTPRHGGLGSVGNIGQGPFGDENAVKEA